MNPHYCGPDGVPIHGTPHRDLNLLRGAGRSALLQPNLLAVQLRLPYLVAPASSSHDGALSEMGTAFGPPHRHSFLAF
jgi:hypothetical protein